MIRMKKLVFAIIISMLLPLAVCAQDDMYFVPKKRTEKEKSTTTQRVRNNRSQTRISGNTYYSGINKTDDEYNRRNKKGGNKVYTCADSTLYSSDSIASDIITFSTDMAAGRNNVKERDTVYVFVADKDEYRYCQYLSRFDDFYWYNRFYGPGWISPWHAYWYFYDPWFDPWFYPWYDPWYRAWYDPWYGPWYNPWRYPYYAGGGFIYYGSGGYGGGGYYPNRGGHALSYSGTHNHHFSGGSGSTGFAHRNGSSTSRNYAVANRNGDRTTYATGARGEGYTGTRYDAFTNGSRFESSRSYTPSSSSSYSGGRSSGSVGGGGGGGFSGGGHSVGGGGSHSGGHFGGGRR